MPSRIFRQVRRSLRTFWSLIDETLDEFAKDRGELIAAALAFYTLLSLAPLIIIAVAIAGIVLGQGTAHQEVLTLLHGTMGPDAAKAIDGWVLEASRAGGVASAVGIGLTLLAASKFTAQLRSALNQIWNVDVLATKGFRPAIKSYVQRQAFAMISVIASGPLLLAVFASRALLTGFGNKLFLHSALTGFFAHSLQLIFSLLLVVAMSAVVFRIVPEVRVEWGAILRGSAMTSVLFNLGNLLVGLYLGKASVGAAYGAAGSVVVVLLWLYFSAQMFLFGAEFTQVYAARRGSVPDVRGRDEPSET